MDRLGLPAEQPGVEGARARRLVRLDEVLGVEEGYAAPEARYERREAIELAFVAALQHLPPRQRAVLILREVLGFSAREVAEALESTPASVNSALQRARKAVAERVPERSQQETVRSLGDARVRKLVERFGDAFERGDTRSILGMLAEDAVFSMPPYPGWCRGRDSVADSWLMPGGPPPRLRFVPTRANGQPAFGCSLRDAHTPVGHAYGLMVLTLSRDRVAAITGFPDTSVFRSFGLPRILHE